MATNAQSSRHKSRLLREMSRDLNRSIHSVASSTGSNHGTVSADSTMTDFNPQKDEAIMSTQQLDNNYSQKLPELRTTAKKYGRWAPREHTDIVINTSAIGRAFPGFSEGDSSDDSVSLEVARGPKSQQRPTPTRLPRAEYFDNVESSPVVTTGSVKILGTPQRFQTKPTVLQDALRNNAAKKEYIPRRDTGSHKENIPPPNTQKPAKSSPYTSHASRTTSGERRTLAELHAQVADDTEGSFIGDERPTTITFQPKNTRFSSVKSHTSHAANVSTKRHEVEDALAEKLRTASGTPSKSQLKPQTNSTAHSNTPNPTQQSFLLPNILDISEVTPTSFNKGTGVPLPGEEQDIYINIDLLKERVADLEMQLAQSQDRNEQLETENRHLQSSAQGERFKLQMERDQAVTQLSVSLNQIEQLAKEIRELKRQQLLTQGERSKMQVERDRAFAQLNESLAKNKQLEKRVEESLRQNEQLKFDFQDLEMEYESFKKEAKEMSVDIDNSTRSLEEKDRSIRRHQEALAKVKDLTLQLTKSAHRSTRKQSFNRNERSVRKDRFEHASKEMEKLFDGNERSMMSEDGSDYASILGSGYMKNLRQQVKDHQAAEALGHDDTSQAIQSVGSSHAPSTKGPTGIQKNDGTQNQDLTGRFSIKSARTEKNDGTEHLEDLTGRYSIQSVGIEKNGGHQNPEDITARFSVKSAGRVEKEHTIRSTTSHRRHHSETSIHTTRRRRNVADDMTSAFIIPDISSNPITTETAHPSLSASARKVLDGLCKHDCTNCTVCARVASFDTKNRTKVAIPKPIPVSERMPEPTPYEDEPTIRPSVEPDLALATVIKELEDEIAHLKLENTRLAAEYTKHDPSLGMRQRKALKKRLDELLNEIERKSDQLYGLYDVLEGQKESGDMAEELPWEGIEETF